MHRNCRNSWCDQMFKITEDDLAFYDRVSPIVGGRKYSIPPPTKCPECRLQRRLTWRNDRTLYRRKCDATGQPTLSIYSSDKPFTVYASSAWWKDTWDPLTYGREVNFNKPFFEQFSALLTVVPRPALNCEQSENCDYCHNTTFSRNCYLCSATTHCEDCYYASSMTNCKDIVDATGIHGSELCVDCINCRNCYRGTSLHNCFECTECTHCFDCQGCNRCIGCIGLVRKDLHIFNRPVSRDAFEATQSALRCFEKWNALRSESEILSRSLPHRNVMQIASENCTGDSIFHSKNARYCFDAENCEDAAYSHHVKNFKDSMDVFGAFMGGELQYENSSAGGSTKTMGAYLSYHNADCCYMNYCHYCNNCFGCVGLRHKQYCILNKQYTKEEYENLMPKIIEHMQRTPLRSPDGSSAGQEWGEFFPETISPYSYNESAAHDYFPLTQEECESRHWHWKDIHRDIPQVSTLIPAEQLPDSIDDVPDDILNWAIVCKNSQKPFKIIPQELAFYRNLRLPLPRLHPDIRHAERMKKRGHGKLWNRACMKCGKEMETTYHPSRPETVYCEKCSMKEMY